MTSPGRLWLVLALTLVIAAVTFSCAPLGGGDEATDEPPTNTPAQPSPQPTPQPDTGKCGDGVCDDKEQADPNICPEDCGTREPPDRGRCGDGVCDEREKAHPDLCPEDCASPRPPDPPDRDEGKCGDGVCDDEEQADPKLCPEDCVQLPPEISDEVEPPDSDEPPPDEIIPSTTEPGPRIRVKLEWTAQFGPCQADFIRAEMEVPVSVDADGYLSGRGNGVMSAEAVERCPGKYGGIRTAPYPVVVKGIPNDTHWAFELLAKDESESYYTSGEVIFRDCVLCWAVPQFKGVGVDGKLSSFSLPKDLQAGDTFRFAIDYKIGQGHHVGEGTLEIVEPPR